MKTTDEYMAEYREAPTFEVLADLACKRDREHAAKLAEAKELLRRWYIAADRAGVFLSLSFDTREFLDIES